MKLIDITPCSSLQVNGRFAGTDRLYLHGRRIRRARNQSERSVDFQRITQPFIPEDRTVHNHRCEDLKSYMRRILCNYLHCLSTSFVSSSNICFEELSAGDESCGIFA
jgi:hypothetical protein